MVYKSFKNEALDIVSVKEAWLVHKELESIIKSGKINKDELEVIDIKDNQRAVVWIDGRFDRILYTGIYALWKVGREVLVEVIDVKSPQFVHEKLDIILDAGASKAALNEFIVEDNHIGLYFENGNLSGKSKTWQICILDRYFQSKTLSGRSESKVERYFRTRNYDCR